jgi:hypothetical protein
MPTGDGSNGISFESLPVAFPGGILYALARTSGTAIQGRGAPQVPHPVAAQESGDSRAICGRQGFLEVRKQHADSDRHDVHDQEAAWELNADPVLHQPFARAVPVGLGTLVGSALCGFGDLRRCLRAAAGSARRSLECATRR